MKQEYKQLLLQDLCARLPYGVICLIHNVNSDDYANFLCEDYLAQFRVNSITLKPYLRPISSMTEEEKHELYSSCDIISLDFERRTTDMVATFNSAKVVDYFNTNHFDYRGLFPKGLAIKVTEDNNPYKE